MGARVGYSWLNALVMACLCLSGTVGLLAFFVPIDSGMAIVLWIGMIIVVQSFNSTPRSHAPAVVIGMLPGIAGWGALIAKSALRAAGLGSPEMPFNPETLVTAFEANDVYITGAFALEQGLIFSSMILSAITVCIIEKKFAQASLWALIAAFLSWLGLLHSFQWTLGDTVLNLGWGKGSSYALSYVLLALLLFYAQWNHKAD
jgi:AGZA family xanthine/uracil permease-like MFS transporter